MTIFQGAGRTGGDEGQRAPDLAAMSAAQLRDLCHERGIKVPRKATKAQLQKLLEG